jgi:predicted anti-sigma-YlaC factor YlaD
MSTLATGAFDVKLTPIPTDDSLADTKLGSMLIDKQFSGDITAHSVGQMLTAMTAIDGSAGYVAVECVTGELHGRKGSFILQHNGSMSDGAQNLTITVVPDSGTGDLSGISGEMKIIISDGQHSFEFDYSLDTDV